MIDRGPRILIGSVEVPTVGGSATAAHSLFRKMLADGYDVHFATFLPEEASTLLRRIDPQLVLGIGFIAARLLKQADAGRRTVFLTGTCRQAQDYVTSGLARDAISLARDLDRNTIRPRIINGGERTAVEVCDLVVTHSPLTRDMFARFFPNWAGKIYPDPISFAEWICEDAAAWRDAARPFLERDIDVLFVASDWARPEKSYSMVRAVARQLDGIRIHIVGKAPSAVPSAIHHGFIGSRKALFELFGRARAVACASHMDAAPGILFEAAAMGCNLVCSKNCGNWELCHPALLADPFGPDILAASIRRAIERPYDPALDRFVGSGAYRELMALLSAFAQPFVAQAV